MATKNNVLTLKLLINTKENKVLFAEAGKDAVDFLFSLLALPIGTVIKLLTKESMVGSIANLYNSVESLDETYFVHNQNKSTLLNPNASASNNLFLTRAEKSTETVVKGYYRCSNDDDCATRPPCGWSGRTNSSTKCKNYVTDTCNTMCPECGCSMYKKMEFVHSTGDDSVGSSDSGFVKGVVTYTVMDDLSIMPMSTISTITMLNKFHVMDIGSLVEKHVDLDINLGLKLLKSSLQSKTVLSDVFLSNKYK